MKHWRSIKCILIGLLWIISGAGYSQQDAQTKAKHDLFLRFGLTDSIQQKLKQKGFDLSPQTPQAKPKPRESVRIFLCDAAVVGKVTAIMNTPAPSAEPFHSKAIIEVERVLKGNLSGFPRIEILRHGGPLSDKKNIVHGSSADQHLSVGEEAIFFLEVPERNFYLQARFHDFFQSGAGHYPGNVFWLDSDEKIPIKNGQCYYSNRTSKPLDDVLKNIETSLKLLEN